MDSYDFESKHLYRQRRERAIDAALSAGRFRDRKVAYLDTKEALDTISYLNRGYRPQNLWAINRNPAEVAALSRKLDKLGFPRVNTVGLDFEEALERRVPEVDVVDFDGMSCLHGKLLDMVYRIMVSRPSCVFGVTILAGRESEDRFKPINFDDGGLTLPDELKRQMEIFYGESYEEVHARFLAEETTNTSFQDHVRRSHECRRRTLLTELGSRQPCLIHITSSVWDVYVSSSRQPMLWCVFKTTPHQPIPLHRSDSWAGQGGVPPGCVITQHRERDKQRIQKMLDTWGPRLRVYLEETANEDKQRAGEVTWQ